MKMLITGANGFVGSQVAKLALQNGHEVFALVRQKADLSRIEEFRCNLNLIHADLLDYEAIKERIHIIKPDTCIHTAWYAEPGKYLPSPKNLDMVGASLHLLYCLAEMGCRRFVGVGSCFEYDLWQGHLSEESKTKPNSLYAASKLTTAEGLHKLAQSLDVSMAWARLFYLYGPGEDDRRLVPCVITSLLRGEEAKTTKGEQIRDYLHVEDVGSALLAVTESKLEGQVNIGSGQENTIADIVKEIAEQIGVSHLLKLGALPYRGGEPPVIVANNRKLVTGTDWKPKFTLQSGLTDTINWWRNQL